MPLRPGNDGSPLRSTAALCVTALVAGAIIGLIGAAFRWCLQAAEGLRVDLLDWAHPLPGPGWLVPVVLVAGCATAAALLVRWEPQAVGSGIPHVESVFLGTVRPPRLQVLPARFAGGVLAIGSGMVLGREGPTVHMGAAVGAESARRFGLTPSEGRLMQAAVGGAGLAVAFNAPVAGVLFTLEEVTKSLRMRTVLVAVLSTAAAVLCSRLVLGDQPDFDVDPLVGPSLAWLPLFAVFGVLTGVLGSGYNLAVLWLADHVAAIRRVPSPAKATAVGAVVGAALYVAPLTVGDGDAVTQMILGGEHVALLLAVGLLAARFLTGPLSYSAAVPGGLFAPLLAVGALWGIVFQACFAAVWPHDTTSLTIPLALVGMTAFFGATVRAPLTGIAIVIEMTATTSVALPMVTAVLCAVLTAMVVKSTPIYDSLRDRMPLEPDDTGEPGR